MQHDLHASDATLAKSDGVVASLSRLVKRGGNVLRLDYEFKGAGFASVRVPVALTLPDNYLFRFSVRGKSPNNTLEVKCVDPSGENVWWVHRPNFVMPSRWQTLINKARHFSYAWGPVNKPLSQVRYLELTISASAGGKGSVYFADLSFEELPAPSELPSSTVKTSSARALAAVIRTADDTAPPADSSVRGWHSSDCERQFIYVDFNCVREFDGLVVDFGDEYAVDYDVQIPVGKQRWKTVDSIVGGQRLRQYHCLPESEARAVRLALRQSKNGRGYEVRSVLVKPIGFATTTGQFFSSVAADMGKGHSPRYFRNEQSFWTVVGVSGGREKAIINEEGMIEPALQAPSLEPFIYTDGRLLTWADGTHEQSLANGYLPLPAVLRRHAEAALTLTVEALAQGPSDSSTLYARYTVRNEGAERRAGSLFIALRHYQVNPPWQFLNFPGGFTPLCALEATDGLSQIRVNGGQVIFPLNKPHGFGATRLSQGDIVEHLSRGSLPQAHGKLSENSDVSIEDDRGFCSGALEYKFDLEPGEETSFALAIPYSGMSKSRPYNSARALAVKFWQKELAHVGIDLPAYPELIDTVKSQLAYILINRDGQALQPGSRCYRRTWIRDASLTSKALLQLGHAQDVRAFIEWFAPFQYPDGKVPCCVDKRGADPTPEHDSHGEFIFLVVEYYRYTRDREFLARMYPRLLKAVEYIDRLRSQRLSSAYEQGENANLYGLMPESISHEGYSAKPAHSYWDDIFAQKGLEDALFAARELSASTAEVQRLATISGEFRRHLVASMKGSLVRWNIDFIPGAADRGDFDPTSTTIALDPADLSAELSGELESTFQAYYQFFLKRRDGRTDWRHYTPYEWRVVGTMTRLGQVERAHEALAFFMQHRRPRGWNHWAEVIFKDPLTPGFIGDAPHGWVGSDFLRSVRALFAYEKADALVVAAGLPESWLKAGLSIRDMQTEHGSLSLTVQAKRDGSGLIYELSGNLRTPVHLIVHNVRTAKRETIVIEQLPARIETP